MLLDIDLSPYVHGFVEGMLRGMLMAWPVWVVLAALMLGGIALGVYRRRFKPKRVAARRGARRYPR